MAVPARPRIACIWPVKFLVFSGTIKLRERYLIAEFVIRFLILCFRQELGSRRTVQKEHGLIAVKVLHPVIEVTLIIQLNLVVPV